MKSAHFSAAPLPTWLRQSAWPRRAALLVILVLAAGLRFARIESLGYANPYYSAAVTGMLQSWHNFFYVAAEPGGSVSVDKPPLGLWIQVASAALLGMSGFAVILPQVLAGVASVALLYHLVRRTFGTPAGLLAALALALTPISVAVDRNNTMDSILILALLLAAWAFIRAAESGRLRHLLLGALLVGLGFNIKMLQAYLPLPAFYGLYLLGAGGRLAARLGRLALASLLLLAVSLSWAVRVDLTPADARPYVGSSSDNSEISLIVGYNGINRLLGLLGRRGTDGAVTSGAPAGAPSGPPGGGNPPPGFQPRSPGAVPFTPGRPDGGAPRGGAPGGNLQGIGQPGALRLFTYPLYKEVSWLLPFGLVSMALLAWRRPRLPLDDQNRALLLWGGWLVTGAVFFSVAGFFHEYYLAMLAPPLAALTGAGAIQLWRLRAARPGLAAGLLLAAAALTLALQTAIVQRYGGGVWLWSALALLALAALLVLIERLRPGPTLAAAAWACVLAAILLPPGVWSALTVLDSGANLSLPAAYGGEGQSRPQAGSQAAGLNVDPHLLEYLQAHTQGMKYLLAVPSSMQGAGYVIATGRPVLYTGGFNGNDPVVDGDDLQSLVDAGDLRYVLWSGGGAGRGGSGALLEWVESNCSAVTGYAAPGVAIRGPGGMGNLSLYECR